MKFQLSLLLIGYTFINLNKYSQNYIHYNSIISSATENTLDSNYTAALIQFDSAFYHYKPFAGDTYLAAQVALTNKNNQLAEKYLLLGATVGLGLDALNYPIFTQFKESSDFLAFKENFEIKHGTYYSSLNIPYRDACIDLVIRDQEANKTHSILNIFRPYSKYTDKKLNRELENIFIDLDSLITTNHGILPFRSAVGVRSFQYDKTMPRNSEGIQSLLLATLFWHYPLIFQKWENQLYFALETGEISARTYSIIRTFCGQHGDNKLDKNMTAQLKYKDHKYYTRWPQLMKEEDLAKVNMERKKIGLYSINYELKIKKADNSFRYQHKQVKKNRLKIEPENYKINYNYYNL